MELEAVLIILNIRYHPDSHIVETTNLHLKFFARRRQNWSEI